MREVELKEKAFKKGSYVRLWLENALGSSEKSDTYKIMSNNGIH